MSKKQSKLKPFLIIIVILVVLIGVSFAFWKFTQETIIPLGSEKLYKTYFLCDVEGGAGYCEVNGVIDSCDTQVDTPKTIARRTGSNTQPTCIAVDSNFDGILETFKFSSSLSSSVKFQPTITFSDTYGIKITSSSGIEYGLVNSFNWATYSKGICDIPTTTTLLEGCTGNEICNTKPAYTCTFNFCPSQNYCYGGGLNKLSKESPSPFGTTEKVKINHGSFVEFNPTDANNLPLPSPKFYLYVTKYLETEYTIGQIRCYSNEKQFTYYQKYALNGWVDVALLTNEVCVNNEIKQKSEVNCELGGTLCPSGKNCVNNACIDKQCGTDFCNPNNPNYLVGQSCVNNQCVCPTTGGWCSKDGTQSPTTDKKCVTSNTFYSCQIISGSCPTWSLTTSTATFPYLCKNNAIVCPTENACTEVGQKRCKDTTTVQECHNIGGCYLWEDKELCNAGEKEICV